MGAGVILADVDLVAQAEGVLHLALGDDAAGFAVVVDAGRGEEVDDAGVEEDEGAGGGGAVEEVGAAEGAVEGADQEVGREVLERAREVDDCARRGLVPGVEEVGDVGVAVGVEEDADVGLLLGVEVDCEADGAAFALPVAQGLLNAFVDRVEVRALLGRGDDGVLEGRVGAPPGAA